MMREEAGFLTFGSIFSIMLMSAFIAFLFLVFNTIENKKEIVKEVLIQEENAEDIIFESTSLSTVYVKTSDGKSKTFKLKFDNDNNLETYIEISNQGNNPLED